MFNQIILDIKIVFNTTMFDQLFGSKTRVSLLKLFFENPEESYFVRELTRELDCQINAVRRELNNLNKVGIIKVLEEIPESKIPEWEEKAPKGLNRKKFYQLNEHFPLREELSSLFSKSHIVVEKELMNRLSQFPQLYVLIMTGFFTEAQDVKTDILIIGNVNKKELNDILSEFEKKLGRDINYTTMSLKEFEYRKEITDKFVYDILVAPKNVVVDKIGIDKDPKQV